MKWPDIMSDSDASDGFMPEVTAMLSRESRRLHRVTSGVNDHASRFLRSLGLEVEQRAGAVYWYQEYDAAVDGQIAGRIHMNDIDVWWPSEKVDSEFWYLGFNRWLYKGRDRAGLNQNLVEIEAFSLAWNARNPFPTAYTSEGNLFGSTIIPISNPPATRGQIVSSTEAFIAFAERMYRAAF